MTENITKTEEKEEKIENIVKTDELTEEKLDQEEKSLSSIDEKLEKLTELNEKINQKILNLEKREKEFEAKGKGRDFISRKETIDEKWAREAKIRYAGTGMDPTA